MKFCNFNGNISFDFFNDQPGLNIRCMNGKKKIIKNKQKPTQKFSKFKINIGLM